MTLGVDGPAPEDRPEIEHVVLDERAVAALDEHVEAVHAARIVVIQPRAEDAGRAQLATVLVRDDVVRIVGARAVVAEVAERLPLREPARKHPILAVRLPGARV